MPNTYVSLVAFAYEVIPGDHVGGRTVTAVDPDGDLVSVTFGSATEQFPRGRILDVERRADELPEPIGPVIS